MGMAAGGSGGFQSEINVTPMVDIMLVLLIIFMVVTPLLQHGVTVNLPKDLRNPEEDQRIIKDDAIVIAIPKDGEYYLGKEKITMDQTGKDMDQSDKDKIKRMLDNIKKEEDKVVYIKSGVGVSYGEVVNIINVVRAFGVDKIGLVADKKKGDGSVTPVPAPKPA